MAGAPAAGAVALVQSCSPAAVKLVGRWWNGRWSRLTRRDVWLFQETDWRVHAREGNSETGRERSWRFSSEGAARGMVDRLLQAGWPGEWRDITDISARWPSSATDADQR